MDRLAALRDALVAGEAFFLGLVDTLDDEALRVPSRLPGWTRAHVVGHLARNADALGNLLAWARTGVETPMYPSVEDRAAGIDASAAQPADALRADVHDASARLLAAVDTLPDAAWVAEVKTARGRPIPATEVPWMRVRESWVHGADLGAGASFADITSPVLTALLDEIESGVLGVGSGPAFVLRDDESGRAWRIGPAGDDGDGARVDRRPPGIGRMAPGPRGQRWVAPATRVALTGGWNRSTRPLILASLTSASGSIALVTALGKQVYDITGRELDLGLLGLAEFAPAALLVLVTGSVADRRDRRRIAAAALTAEAVTVLLLLAYISTEPTAVGPIFAIAFLFGVARTFAAPAVRSLPADVVPPGQLPWLVARWSASFQLALIIGPVLGGSLYAVDVKAPYLAVVGLLAAAAMLMIRVQVPAVIERPPTPPGGLHQAFEGLRFIRSQPILFGAISLDLFAVLFGGAVALLPAIAEERLGVGAVGYGWLRAATGIGAGAVTLVLARRPIRHGVGRTLLLAVAVFGVGTIALGLTRNYAVAFVAILVLAGADALSVFIRSTLVPLVTPPDKRGRVLAVEMVFIGASNELGAFESGVAGQFLGPATAVCLGGAATLAIAAGYWRLFPALRRVDEFPTVAVGTSHPTDR